MKDTIRVSFVIFGVSFKNTTDQNIMSTIASFYTKLYSELYKTPFPFTVKKKHRKNSFLNFILLKLTKIAWRLCTRQMR